MKKRFTLTFTLLAATFYNTFAQSTYTVSQFAQDIKELNTSTILPLLGAGLGVYAIVSGFMRLSRIRKGGEEQTDAIMNWLGSLIWPVVVVIVSEAIILTFSSIFA